MGLKVKPLGPMSHGPCQPQAPHQGSSLRLDEREVVQKKTFTKWVNSHLARVSCRITDLYKDLRDGRMLIKLLEVLSGEMLVKSLPWAPGLLPSAPLQQRHGLGASQVLMAFPVFSLLLWEALILRMGSIHVADWVL